MCVYVCTVRDGRTDEFIRAISHDAETGRNTSTGVFSSNSAPGTFSEFLSRIGKELTSGHTVTQIRTERCAEKRENMFSGPCAPASDDGDES